MPPSNVTASSTCRWFKGSGIQDLEVYGLAQGIHCVEGLGVQDLTIAFELVFADGDLPNIHAKSEGSCEPYKEVLQGSQKPLE